MFISFYFYFFRKIGGMLSSTCSPLVPISILLIQEEKLRCTLPYDRRRFMEEEKKRKKERKKKKKKKQNNNKIKN